MSVEEQFASLLVVELTTDQQQLQMPKSRDLSSLDIDI